MAEPTLFVPGAYWTPERARASFDALVALLNTDEMQTLFRTIAEASAESGDPAAASAAAAPSMAIESEPISAITREGCIFRRGNASDIPALVPLIVSGDLPPFFLEPVIDGFLVVEHAGRLVASGGLEFYGEDAVLRSVVVDPAARGLGLGLNIGRLLEEDAFASGARDLYLFTMHAHGFWQRLGYTDLALDQWPELVRENWQYQFVAGYPDASRDVFRMVKRGSR